MIQREKRYVEVDVRFSTEGRLRPLQIIFDKGQVYKIDKIKDICRRAADVGGVGDRYTCMIQGKERDIELELDNGFIMSPKDLKTVDFVDDMVAAGVKVFKVEGMRAARNMSKP